jgi:hypothetical protein
MVSRVGRLVLGSCVGAFLGSAFLLNACGGASTSTGGSRGDDSSKARGGSQSGSGAGGSGGSVTGGAGGAPSGGAGAAAVGGAAGAAAGGSGDCQTAATADACQVLTGHCSGDSSTNEQCVTEYAAGLCAAGACQAELDAYANCLAEGTPICTTRYNDTRVTGVDCRVQGNALLADCLGRQWSCEGEDTSCNCVHTFLGPRPCPATTSACCVTDVGALTCWCEDQCDTLFPESEGWIRVPSCPPP